MRNNTQLWQEVTSCLMELNDNDDFMKNLYNKFNEIFLRKEIQEYKNLTDAEWMTPVLFTQVDKMIKRAFVEGYLLSKAEQRKDNIASLYRSYNKKGDKNEKSNKSRVVIRLTNDSNISGTRS